MHLVVSPAVVHMYNCPGRKKPQSALPTMACALQGGDCFDMSQVLCSLLLGAGYDAYVVAGYAPLSVACNDQSSAICPVLEAERPKTPKPAAVVTNTKQQSLLPKEVKYKIRSDAKMESTFLKVVCHQDSSVALLTAEVFDSTHCTLYT